MINLLTPEQAEASRRAYRQRYLVVALYLLLSLIIISIILSASAYWRLRQQHQDLGARVESLKNQDVTKEYTSLSGLIKKDLERLKILEPAEEQALSPDQLLALLGRHQNTGISLTSIDYKLEEAALVAATIKGQASTRDSLLALVAAFKSDQSIATVDSPISNLIRDRELEFVLELKLKPQSKTAL